MPAPLHQRLSLIDNRFEVDTKIGEGTFSEIYRVRDVKAPANSKDAIAAVKVEKEESVLKLETNVLRNLQNSPNVCRLIHSGLHNALPYLVMELLGENLSELRRKQKGTRFSLSTTVLIGKQMLESIKGCHEMGYLHRDVKPSNVAMGTDENRRRCYVIDFGLSKRFLTDDGEVLPARKNAQFRGTSLYASVHAHQHKDLGRRDDLWSLLYVLAEFLDGDLPWRSMTDKEEVRAAKEAYNRNPQLMMRNVSLPDELKEVMMYLRSLDFEDAPDYTYVSNQLQAVCDRLSIKDDEPFDWETNAATNIGQGRRVGAKGGSHGSGREKDTERRERKEREREKRDKEELRQRSRDQRAAAVVEVHVRAGGGDGASGGGGGGGASEMDYKYFSNNVGGERRGSTLQHATAAPNASLLPVVEPELTVEAPYRPGGARDAQPQAYAPGGNAARSRGDMAAASGDAGATSEAREKQSIHANAVRICFSVITRGSCPKVECSLFHPPRNPPRPAVGLCLDFISRKCGRKDCPRYHWTEAEETEYRRCGALPSRVLTSSAYKSTGPSCTPARASPSAPPQPTRVTAHVPSLASDTRGSPAAAEVMPRRVVGYWESGSPAVTPPVQDVSVREMHASVTERLDRLIISGLLAPEQVQEPLWQLLLTVPEAAALDALTEFAARQRDSRVSNRAPTTDEGSAVLADLLHRHQARAAAAPSAATRPSTASSFAGPDAAGTSQGGSKHAKGQDASLPSDNEVGASDRFSRKRQAEPAASPVPAAPALRQPLAAQPHPTPASQLAQKVLALGILDDDALIDDEDEELLAMVAAAEARAFTDSPSNQRDESIDEAMRVLGPSDLDALIEAGLIDDDTLIEDDLDLTLVRGMLRETRAGGPPRGNSPGPIEEKHDTATAEADHGGDASATGADVDNMTEEDAVPPSKSEAPSKPKVRPRLRVVGLSRATTAAPTAAADAPPPSLAAVVLPKEEDDRLTVDFNDGGSIARAADADADSESFSSLFNIDEEDEGATSAPPATCGGVVVTEDTKKRGRQAGRSG